MFLYVGLLQWALGLSRTKGESPKDSYNATPRENPVVYNFNFTHVGAMITARVLFGNLTNFPSCKKKKWNPHTMVVQNLFLAGNANYPFLVFRIM